MATFTKTLLSGSTNGRNVKVVATATAGTLIHTAIAGTTSLDEVYLYACNTSGSAVTLTIEWGGVTSPDDLTVISLPATSGRILIADGKLLQNGLVIRAFASSANVIVIDGFVNRIS